MNFLKWEFFLVHPVAFRKGVHALMLESICKEARNALAVNQKVEVGLYSQPHAILVLDVSLFLGEGSVTLSYIYGHYIQR